MGGSADVDANRELQTDQNLGATRIDEAARRAVAQLQTQREQERLNATNLVNAGAGEDAVISAQAGLKNSLDNVSTAQKANLFGDLFSTGADAFASQNYNQALAAQLARYQSSLGAFSRPARAAARYPERLSHVARTPSTRRLDGRQDLREPAGHVAPEPTAAGDAGLPARQKAKGNEQAINKLIDQQTPQKRAPSFRTSTPRACSR
jgi:hypothetical protein